MKYIFIILFLFLASCRCIYFGQHDYQFLDEGNKFPNGYKITIIFNDSYKIDYYKNFEMKLDNFKVDYSKFEKYKDLK